MFYGTGTFVRSNALSLLNTIMTSGGSSGWTLFDGATSGDYVVFRDPAALRPVGRDPIYLAAKIKTEKIGLARRYTLYFELYEEWSASAHEAVASTAWTSPTVYENANYTLEMDDLPRAMNYWFSVDTDRVVFAIESHKGYQGVYAGALAGANASDAAPYALNYFHVNDVLWMGKNFAGTDNSAKSGYKYQGTHLALIPYANATNGGSPGDPTNALWELERIWAINKTFSEKRGYLKNCYAPATNVTSEDIITVSGTDYICFNSDNFRIAFPKS